MDLAVSRHKMEVTDMIKKMIALTLVICCLAMTSSFSVNAASTPAEWADYYENDLISGRISGKYANSIYSTSDTWYEDYMFAPDGLGGYIEVVNRTVFAEAPYWLADKQSVAWVIYNRRSASGYYPVDDQTLYGVVTMANQFAVITNGGTAAAKRPMQEDPSGAKWDNSAKYVGAIWAAVKTSTSPNNIMSGPSGYAGQLEFRSVAGFFREAQTAQEETTNGYAYDCEEDGLIHYRRANGTEFEVYNIFIPRLGIFYSVESALTAYKNEYGSTFPQSERVNIYFNSRPLS